VKVLLLPNFVEMIHLWFRLRIVVDDLNRHQTWHGRHRY
jgi:hypothetical protein